MPAAQGVEDEAENIDPAGRAVIDIACRRRRLGTRTCACGSVRRRAFCRSLSLLSTLLLSLSALLIPSRSSRSYAPSSARLYRTRTAASASRRRASIELLVLLPESTRLLSLCERMPGRLATSVSATAGTPLIPPEHYENHRKNFLCACSAVACRLHYHAQRTRHTGVAGNRKDLRTVSRRRQRKPTEHTNAGRRQYAGQRRSRKRSAQR